ncbi:TetR/AcrR family transcriptional regulator [Saccharopolyspora sp. MS10]|uniref:TetR/AcrR family transcriptional regulator n=1 Tax=Saccharopolyspora sp. MS10 TaxID=3385973 RepID=UPI0039A1DF25
MGRESGRPLRSDARRNRDKILCAALRMFGERGLNVHLDHIAKEAGVGAGTLYRNFPTREELIEAAYRHELTTLCESVPRLRARLPPQQALREWMIGFLDYATAKMGLADALRSVVDWDRVPSCESREMLLDSITPLLTNGAEAGVIRADVPPEDLLVALMGIALATGRAEQRDQAERLLDLLFGGLLVRR